MMTTQDELEKMCKELCKAIDNEEGFVASTRQGTLHPRKRRYNIEGLPNLRAIHKENPEDQGEGEVIILTGDTYSGPQTSVVVDIQGPIVIIATMA